MSKPLYTLVHVPKSGGNNFTKHIYKCNEKDTCIELSPKLLNLTEDYNHNIYVKSINKYLKSLSYESLDKLKFLSGHVVPFCIHQLLLQKEVRYITFIRNPIYRIVSLYNYLRTQYQFNPQDPDLNIRLKKILFINNKIPKFEDWYNQVFLSKSKDYSLFDSFTFYNQLGYIDSKKNNWIDNFFNKFFYIATDKSYPDDSMYLFNLLGINKFFLKSNLSIKYFQIDFGSRLYNKMLNNHQKSMQLYESALKYNLLQKERFSDFNNIVQSMKIKRFLYLPFTQAYYDWRELLHQLKLYKLQKEYLDSKKKFS